MGTLNFDEIPQYTQDYLAAATLAAVRRFAQSEAGKALKEETEEGESR